jgi:hypothetical protein
LRAAISASAPRASTRRGRCATTASAPSIAPSFGEIFLNNSLKNGFLPIALTESEVDKLFYDAASFPGFKLIVNLEKQVRLDQRWLEKLPLRHRPVPQALHAERPRRDRPHPAPRGHDPRLRDKRRAQYPVYY